MPFVAPNFVFETTEVEGTGTLTLLGAVGDFLDFDSQLANLDTAPYTIEFGAEKEVGLGIFTTSGQTLTRGTVWFSTNGGAAVDFGAGTKNVYSGIPGEVLGSLMDPTRGTGFISQIATNTYERRTLQEGNGITITDAAGVAAPPTIGTTFKRVEEFGAVEGVGQETANNTAFAAIETYLATTNAAAVVFSEGIWVWSDDINWAQADHTQVLGQGVVRLRYTGTGDAFILDGGAASQSPGFHNMKVGPFLIEAHDGAGDGVYIRALHHSNLDFNVRGCGTTQAAMRILWGVANDIRLISSGNEDGGWYNDGTGDAIPLYGLYIDRRVSDGWHSAYNTFVNPILEVMGTGCYLDYTIGNQFYSGTMEGCTTLGLNISANSALNVINGTDFEVNDGGLPDGHDIEITGDQNILNDVASDSMLTLKTGARFNRINSGSFFNIEVESGAILNVLNQCTYDRHGVTEASFVDNGTDTVIRDLINFRLVTIIGAGGRGAYDSELTNAEEISLPAAPNVYTHTNTSGYRQSILITGGFVSEILFIRNSIGDTSRFQRASGDTLGNSMFELSPTDGVRITYSLGPAVYTYSR